MAKKSTNLDLPEIEAPSKSTKKEQTKGGKNGTSKKPQKKRKSIGKFFRDIISELKKVTWGSFKKSKDNSSVQAQTGIVLVITVFFMIVLAAIDAGLAQLLKLLLNA